MKSCRDMAVHYPVTEAVQRRYDMVCYPEYPRRTAGNRACLAGAVLCRWCHAHLRQFCRGEFSFKNISKNRIFQYRTERYDLQFNLSNLLQNAQFCHLFRQVLSFHKTKRSRYKNEISHIIFFNLLERRYSNGERLNCFLNTAANLLWFT